MRVRAKRFLLGRNTVTALLLVLIVISSNTEANDAVISVDISDQPDKWDMNSIRAEIETHFYQELPEFLEPLNVVATESHKLV